MKQIQQPLLDYIPDDDGYTLDAYIEPVRLLHNAVRFSYRPVDILERAVLVEINRSLSEKDVNGRFADVMAKKLTKWDVQQRTKDDTLIPLPITKNNLLRLKPSLWVRMLNIVLWSVEGGDLDPAMPRDEILKASDLDFEAILAGQRIGDVRLEGDRKN